MLQEHPRIAKVLCAGVVTSPEGVNWGVGVMPLYEGGTLDYWMYTNGRFGDLPCSVRIVKEVASAVEHIHRQGLIHRDIKPRNILMLANGQTALSDFGLVIPTDTLARTEQENATLDWGTEGYAAPEQHRKEPSAASDQYALAVTARYLLTGKEPEREKNILEDTSDLPPAIEPVIRRALSEEEKERYPSVTAFAHDLEDEAFKAAGPGNAARTMYPQAWSRQQSRGLTHTAQRAALGGDYEKALRLYDMALVHDPMNTRAHFQAAHVLESLGRYDEAQAAFERVSHCPVKTTEDWVRNGIARARLGDHVGAVHMYRKAKRPEHHDAVIDAYEAKSLEVLAEDVRRLGYTKEASVLYHKAQKLYGTRITDKLEEQPTVAMAVPDWADNGKREPISEAGIL